MKLNKATEYDLQNAGNHPAIQAGTIQEQLKNLTMHMPVNGYIRQADLIPRILPFSAASLWRFVKAETFPAPYKLSERITAWRLDEVMAWADKAPKHQVHKRKVND